MLKSFFEVISQQDKLQQEVKSISGLHSFRDRIRLRCSEIPRCFFLNCKTNE
jgi:hypothetical protein